jgi:hypothetical protein
MKQVYYDTDSTGKITQDGKVVNSITIYDKQGRIKKVKGTNVCDYYYYNENGELDHTVEKWDFLTNIEGYHCSTTYFIYDSLKNLRIEKDYSTHPSKKELPPDRFLLSISYIYSDASGRDTLVRNTYNNWYYSMGDTGSTYYKYDKLNSDNCTLMKESWSTVAGEKIHVFCFDSTGKIIDEVAQQKTVSSCGSYENKEEYVYRYLNSLPMEIEYYDDNSKPHWILQCNYSYYKIKSK